MIDFLPEASSAPPAVRRRYFWRTLAGMSVFVAAYLGATIASKVEAGPVLIAALAAASLAGLGVFLYEFVTLVRALDELQQRIQITALAIGFGVILTGLTALALLASFWETALTERALGLAAALALPSGGAAYLIALHVVKRRYQ